MRHKSEGSAARPINLLTRCVPRSRWWACGSSDDAAPGRRYPGAGFQIRGWSRGQYNAKRETVAQVVGDVMQRLADAQDSTFTSEPVVKSTGSGDPAESRNNLAIS
jgi:hypothetical protein